MKELSIEQKAKRYDKALVIARSRYNIETEESVRICLELMFPELKESEDEKTKRIILSISSKMSSHLRDIFTEEEFQCFDAWSNAWFEKQGEQKPDEEYNITGIGSKNAQGKLGEMIKNMKPINEVLEQKPAEWTAEDKSILFCTISDLKFLRDIISKDPKYAVNIINIEREINWLESLKDRVQPKQEWSEEDRRMLIGLIDELDAIMNKATSNEISVYSKYTNWLKSLRPQNIWKPSDEQMEAMQKARLALVARKIII